MRNSIGYGDLVLIVFDEKRKYLLRVEESKEFHTDKGFFKLKDLIGLNYGSKYKTNLGFEFRILKPTLPEIILKVPRKTQIIYPKDSGFILLLSSIGPGSRVVEAGSGSGALTLVLAYYVKPGGKVYSYEINEERLKSVDKLLRRLGLREYVELKMRDVRESIEEKNIDSVILDLADPWNVLDPAYEALKPSGTLIAFIPTINQLEKMAYAVLDHGGYVEPKAYELMLREYKVKRGEIRPHTWAVGHTGYILFTRKVEKDKA